MYFMLYFFSHYLILCICLCVCICPRSNVENQILKAGFTSREIVIMENDDPGGVFEFSLVSRGPWVINVSPTSKLKMSLSS